MQTSCLLVDALAKGAPFLCHLPKQEGDEDYRPRDYPCIGWMTLQSPIPGPFAVRELFPRDVTANGCTTGSSSRRTQRQSESLTMFAVGFAQTVRWRGNESVSKESVVAQGPRLNFCRRRNPFPSHQSRSVCRSFSNYLPKARSCLDVRSQFKTADFFGGSASNWMEQAPLFLRSI